MKATRLPAMMLLLGASVALAADDAGMKALIKAQAQEIHDAMSKDDFTKIADLTYPALVKEMGGREKMIAVMEAGIKKMKAGGFGYIPSTVEEPSEIVKGGDELFVIVPYELKMKIPDGTMRQKTYLIGISGDEGKSWTFLSGTDDRKMRNHFMPKFPQSLKVPPVGKYVVEKTPAATAPANP
jgi:hypothetical protein